MQRVAQPGFFSRFSGSIGLDAAAALAVCVLCLAPLRSFARDYVYIGGSPTTTIAKNSVYDFQPWVVIPAASRPKLKWAINNKPYWASFDTSTGRLHGKVYSDQVGTYRNITISAHDGRTHAFMPTFAITVTATGSTKPPIPGRSAPTISGTPATSVMVGAPYSFKPAATDTDGDRLTFSVRNSPSWATFNTRTGQLSGTPGAAAVGTTSNIVITVSDGKSIASLPAFSVTVAQAGSRGTATLSWTPPTTNLDGSPLTNLAGYIVNWGTSAATLTHSAQIGNPGTAAYTVTNLSSGTWYFDIVSYNNLGRRSPLSSVVSANIQ